MAEHGMWYGEAQRAQAECIRQSKTIFRQRLLVLALTILAVGGWLGVGLLLTMLAEAAL